MNKNDKTQTTRILTEIKTEITKNSKYTIIVFQLYWIKTGLIINYLTN